MLRPREDLKVVILVPRRGGFADRDRLWTFARTWWVNDHPDWQIFEGTGPEEGPFNRSAALNDAAAKAGDWDVAILIDADVLCDPNAVRSAVYQAHVTNGMVLAYHERGQLTRAGTERVMNGFKGNWRPLVKLQSTYGGFLYNACSSAVVVSRDLWDAVGGFDETFVGWGWEDVAFRVACETVSGQEMAKIASTCWHLWHTVSSGNNRNEPTFKANKARGERYNAARFNLPEIRKLLEEAGKVVRELPAPESRKRTIPRIFHRTVPAETNEQVEAWWSEFEAMHPGWQMMTHRDPMDPADWPETGDLWDKCGTGAQKAGLIRLEALWRWGGIYVDSDVEPYRSFEPFLDLQGFAGWEDNRCVPDAILGAKQQHPAVGVMLELARKAIEKGKGAWESGPGVTTSVLPGRPDWLLLPPGTLFPYHYSVKEADRGKDHKTEQPWAHAAHHWHFSWEQKK